MVPAGPTPFWPTRPPADEFVPLETLPLALELEIVPGFVPTRPPARFCPPFGPLAPLPMLTFTCAVDPLIVPN